MLRLVLGEESSNTQLALREQHRMRTLMQARSAFERALLLLQVTNSPVLASFLLADYFAVLN
jgi:hypothetical protein